MNVTSGKLRLTVIEAKLKRDTDFWTKMDPYCKLKIREDTYKTKVLNNAGKLPKWNETFEIPVKYIGDDMLVEVWDEDVAADDVVGSGNVKLSSLCANGGIDEWFDIFYKGKKAGNVHFKSVFVAETRPQQVAQAG